jgi:hypothetical protein
MNWDIQHLCYGTSSLCNAFLDPVEVDCTVLPLEQ